MIRSKISNLKPYRLGAILMIVFAATATYLPKVNMGNEHADMYFGMPVSEASIQQEFFNDPGFNVQQLNGVKIVNPETGKLTYYFEYIANKQDTLRRISAMPFLKDNRKSSMTCERMYSELNPMENNLTQEERDASSFFWDVRAEEFTFYECYKSPVKHTVLLSKTSDRILHKIEFV